MIKLVGRKKTQRQISFVGLNIDFIENDEKRSHAWHGDKFFVSPTQK